MAALPKISETQRLTQLKEGQKNNVFPRASEYNKLIDRVNSFGTEDGNLTLTGDVTVDDLTVGDDLLVTGDLTVTTLVALNDTTDSTSKDTGAVITQGGVGIEKSVFAGLTINAGTSLTIGTDVTLAKEVNHTISVATTTTAATAGATLAIAAGTGATSGAGGAATLRGGAAGVTAGAAGGAVNITGGAEGAGLGVTGAVNITSPAATGGAAGNITIAPGTSSSTTIAPVVILNKGVVSKKLDTSMACGTTVTGIALVGGNLSVTGTTGNLTLPSAADITTAIGATPVGTTIEFVVNTVGMTAGNVCTIALGANIVTQKMISAGDIATDQLLTVTNTAGINMGIFRLCYITATTCSLHRIG